MAPNKALTLASAMLASVIFLLAGCSNAQLAPDNLLIPLPGDLSEYQRAILEDAVVTESEYLQAVRDEAQCVEQKGYVVTEITQHIFDPTWQYGVEYQVGESEAEAEARRRDRDACIAQFTNFITRYYIAQHVPEGAVREEAFQVLIECLDGYGITGVTSGFTESEVVAAIWEVTGDDMDFDIEVMMTCFFPNRFIFPEGG